MAKIYKVMHKLFSGELLTVFLLGAPDLGRLPRSQESNPAR